MKREISEKIVLGLLRFLSILFWIFEKGDQRKNCARFFKICKYTFLISGKEDKQKICFSICEYTFLIFQKGDKWRKMCEDL